MSMRMIQFLTTLFNPISEYNLRKFKMSGEKNQGKLMTHGLGNIISHGKINENDKKF